MTKDNNPIDYSKGHAFIYGNKDYHLHVEANEDYRLKVYNYIKPSGPKANEIECQLIADDIANKINNKVEVYDESLHSLRKCDFKDFAIIIDRSTNFATYKRIFAERNIPLRIIGSESLITADVTFVIKNLMKLLFKASMNLYDEEYEHSFFSVARSFLVEVKDDELLKIHKDKSYLTTFLGQKIELLKYRLKYAPLYEIFITLLNEFDFYKKLISIGNFSNNSHKIETLCNLSKTLDSLGFTLEEFVTYFEDLNNYNLDIEFSDNDIVDNSVTLITIHKSKGLEYKICYFPGLSKKFNAGQMTSYIASKEYGLLLPYTENNAPSSLLNHLYRENDRKANLEEKLRLFYVALTRAQERIILFNPIEADKDSKPVYDLNKIVSFSGLVNYTNIANKYGFNVSYKNVSLNYQYESLQYLDIKRKDIHVDNELLEEKHASKTSKEKVDFRKLEFGTRLHSYLEAVDFVKKDSSFIKDTQFKKYVDNVINNHLFLDLENAKIIHEYHFYDDVHNVNGVIDLLIIKENEILIIDFKLKNIDDEAYVKQLNIYKDFISTLSDKRIKLYLISAITGKEELLHD